MSDGRLTDKQRKIFGEWMNSRAALIGKCGLCGHREWGITEHIVEIRPFHGGDMVIGGPIYPYVGMICQNCGNTHFVNAVASGVVKAAQPVGKGDKDGSTEESDDRK